MPDLLSILGALSFCVHLTGLERVIRGGGWIDTNKQSGFDHNRRDTVSRCLERGINWVDACCIQEVKAYSKALKGRREKMYMACSWEQLEVRRPQYRTLAKLQETMDWGLKDGGIDYCGSAQHGDPIPEWHR